MLKTYRIIPLVFIICLFGFTLITESPVFAQMSLEDRINKIEIDICFLHPDALLCEDKRMEAENQMYEERAKSFDKDPFTYGPDGSVRQSLDGKFRCIGFPEVRSWPECEKKFKEAKE